jgi:predicted phage terminase large subunit-like protein
MIINLADAKAELSRRSLHAFLQYIAWPVLMPGVEFKDNWHIHAICEHLEAVKSGQIKKLIINIPFRHLKSTIVSQAFPAWDWIADPQLQYLTGSYSKDLATRDAVNSRRIMESTMYRQHFGDSFKMTSDQNVKTRYENDKSGSRVVTSTDGAATGFGGNRRIVDDPISSKEADSIPAIQSSIEWWKGTMATRGNDPETDTTILVHQRVNESDLTGYILANEEGWEHLILPLRYEQEFAHKTSLGFTDPRTKKGELLHPDRMGEKASHDLEVTLGVYHANAQLQQRPDSRGGNIFVRALWKFYKELPTLDEYVISVDCTFKDKQSSDFVAIHVWGRKAADKYLMHRIKEHLGFGATVTAIRAVKALFPKPVAVLIEDKANGSAVIETLQKEISGIIAINPEGGKVARAFAIQPEHEAGNLWLPDPSIDPKIEIYLAEASSFPNPAINDDEVDATTQAINWYRNRTASMGLMEFYRKQAEEKAAKDRAHA